MTADPLTQLPDYPGLRQIQDALWGAGEIRGAAVMVGAGMSKAADRAAEDTRPPPLWQDFADAMSKRLQTLDPTRDPLKLADEYEAALGRHALDSLIREHVRDGQWHPGHLHERLLDLPWADVLTTNWDTLLERTQPRNPDRIYEVVRTPADIARTRAPRIIKLHGSLPSHTPFIFTGEDFRTYPRLFAPFVNLAQEVLLENELCLIGFSGDDPNFVQWSGWVRDQLGISARRIRLVGPLNLTPSRRKVLEQHNVSPIDLYPAVASEPSETRHLKALNLFLDSLWAARPQAPHIWVRSELGAQQLGAATHPNSFQEIVAAWERDRLAYPGWAVAPYSARMSIRHATNTVMRSFTQGFDGASTVEKIKAICELAWRYDVSLWPLDAWLTTQIDYLTASHLADMISWQKQLLLRLRSQAARLAQDVDAFTRATALLDASEAGPEISAYERALWARDRFDYAGIDAELAKLSGNDPLWQLRRASLRAKLGLARDAAMDIREALLDIHSRRRRDPRSIWLLSREAWAGLMMRAAQYELDGADVAFDEETWSEQRARYASAQCEPWDEIHHFDREVEESLRKQRPEGNEFKLNFDAGVYQLSTGINFVSDVVSSPMEGLLMLSERIGLPAAVGMFGILGDRVERALELELENTAKSAWRVASFVRHYDKGVIDRAFNRVAVARLPEAVVEELFAALRGAVVYSLDRVATDKRSHWASQTRILLELCSRLVVRFKPNTAQAAFIWGTELAADSRVRHWWLFSALGNLLRRSLEAIPPGARHNASFAVLTMTVPGERSAEPMEREWPDLSLQLSAADVRRPPGDTRWSHRIDQLLELSSSQEELKRARALWRLFKLHEAKALTSDETAALGVSLWSKVGTDGVPLHTHLLQFALLMLPEDRPGRAKEMFHATVLQPLLDGKFDADGLNNLTGAATANLFTISEDEAARILMHMLDWKAPAPTARHVTEEAVFMKTTMHQAMGACASRVLLPVVSAGDISEELRDRLLVQLNEVGNSCWLESAAQLIRLYPDRTEDVLSALRRGLSSGAREHLRHAVLGVYNFLRGGLLHLVPMHELVLEMIASCTVRRDAGLSWLLFGISEIANAEGLEANAAERISVTLDALWSDLSYETWNIFDPRTEAMSLIRRDCVRTAAALRKAGVDKPIVAEWLSLENVDPLPEVRFALTDWGALL